MKTEDEEGVVEPILLRETVEQHSQSQRQT